MILRTEEEPYNLSIGKMNPSSQSLRGSRHQRLDSVPVELTDYDGGGNDFVGRDELFIELFEILSSAEDSLTYSIELSENNHVRVEFTIEGL